jgi:peroxiredoxin/uncharacterized membrane protein YphA (DoxX/SURF4 family)
MEIWLLAARLILAFVFGTAAIAKLLDRKTSRQTFIDFGLPENFAAIFTVLLPIAELSTAVILLPVQSAWAGAIAALTLLLLFTLAIAWNLARGNKPDCNCFGQLHSEPIGGTTIMRNLFLSALAVLLIAAGKESAGTDIFRWINQLTLSERANFFLGCAVVCVLLAIAWLLKQAVKQQAAILQRVADLENKLSGDDLTPTQAREDAALPQQQLPIGSPAPDFSLADLQGQTVSLQNLLSANKPLFLFFVAPTCSPCAALRPEIARWQKAFSERLDFVIISKGTAAENRAKFAPQGIETVLLQNQAEVSESYGAKWTPAAVFVKADGTIGSHIAYGSEEIKKLFHHVAKSNEIVPWTSTISQRNGHANETLAPLQIGEEAPPLSLPDIAGKTVGLTDFRGKKTMLLFWSPECSYCEKMLDDLRFLESQASKSLPQILIISKGTAEANLALNLRSPILLDEDFETSKIFGAAGTPSAILLDEKGRIASAVGVGAKQVFALAGVNQLALQKQRPAKIHVLQNGLGAINGNDS